MSAHRRMPQFRTHRLETPNLKIMLKLVEGRFSLSFGASGLAEVPSILESST